MNIRAWATRNVLLPLALLPTRSRYLRLARDIQARQFWPFDKIRQFQLEQLRALVEKALKDSTYYRRRLGELGLTVASLRTLNDVSMFPITTKADIEANFPDGMTAIENRTEDWHYAGTRGTTRRVVVIHDFDKRDAERACELVVMTTDCPFSMGETQVAIPPDACSTHCGLEGKRSDRVRGHLWDLISRRKPINRDSISDLRGLIMDRWIRCYQSLPPMEPGCDDKTLGQYVEQIRHMRPRMLVALPEYLRALADYILRTGERLPRIEVVRPMGANMPASWKPSLERAFGGMVRENYGSRELGPMAFDCNLRTGLHVLMDQYLIEVVDAEGQAVPDGQLGQLVITDLQNWTMPLLRYRIGDLARVDRSRCPCGRFTMRLTLEGRTEDSFETPSGTLTAEAVSNYMLERFGIDQFELSEHGQGQYRLRYVRPQAAVLNDDEIGKQIASDLGLPGELRVRQSSLIRPESSGKFRHCKPSSNH